MRDLIQPFLEGRRRFIVIGAGAAGIIVIVIVLILALSGGDDADAEIQFEFSDDPAGGLSVEEQVAQTVAASVPTETPVPTLDIPATIAAEAEMLVQTREASQVLTPTPVVETGSGRRSLTPTESRRLDELGRPMWLAVRSHLTLQDIFAGLPEDVLTPDHFVAVQRVRDDVRRAETTLEGLVASSSDLSPVVRDYVLHIEDLVLTVKDANDQAILMFGRVDVGEDSYGDLTDDLRRKINSDYYLVGDYLDQFERGMSRLGCAACGELYRGR